MTGGWQQQVYDQPALGIAGNRWSNNPIYTVPAGPGGLVSGRGSAGLGVPVGVFAWTSPPDDPNGTDTVVQNFGAGPPVGFVPNDIQATNTVYLSNAGLAIVPGMQMYLIEAGDYLCLNAGSGAAEPGMKAYANFADGTVTFAATGSPTTVASATGSSIAASTFSATGSIADDVLTVTAVGSGTIVNGATISGTGIVTNTKVVAQLSGTAGGVGTYLVNYGGQTVASTTVSGTYGTFTVGTLTTTPVFAVNQTLNATGSVVAGTKVTQLLTGTGGTGSTFAVDNNTVVSSQTISSVGNVETKFYARSSAAAGGLVKISSTTLAGGQ